jgi:hypothetical protein
MPKNKHKRKASAHSKPKATKAPGLITRHPQVFLLIGGLLFALSIYLLTFKSQDNAMFGLAMLSLISGVILTISAKMSVTKENTNQNNI